MARRTNKKRRATKASHEIDRDHAEQGNYYACASEHKALSKAFEQITKEKSPSNGNVPHRVLR